MIWVIGGTVNGFDLGKLLKASGYNVILSVTTAYGKQLSEANGIEVVQGQLSSDLMTQLIVDYGVSMVVDASHPYATEVSQNAISVTAQLAIPYVRYERQDKVFASAKYVSDYLDAVNYLSTKTGNVMLTTGSKHIAQFTPLGVDRLYARVLLNANSINICQQAGFKMEQVIGISGVCSVQLNCAIFKEYNIKYLVTKSSGSEGGLNEKIEAAILENVEVVIIERPKVNYPVVFSDYPSILSFIKNRF